MKGISKFGVVLVAVAAVEFGCAGGEGIDSSTVPTSATAIDNDCNGATDESVTTVAPPPASEPKAAKQSKPEYPRARLTCPEICRVTVRSQYKNTFAVVVIMIDGEYVSLNNLEFAGMIEFPVYEGQTIDLAVGGDSTEFHTVLEMLSQHHLFKTIRWTGAVFETTTYMWQGFKGGNFDVDKPYHYEVVLKLVDD